MTGLKPKWLELINLLDIKGFGDPSYFVYKLREIYQILEDVHSVASMTELQEAVDSIGAEAGTIFIEAGTHAITVPIDIDGGGSLVIYGHGDNTILEVADGISAFNITDCASLTIKNLQIDASNYTGATSSVIVNETNDNVITFEDVTIIGNFFGTGIELISNNCIIEHCNISQLQDGIYLNNSNRHIIAQNILQNNARYGINLNTVLYSSINGNISNSNLMGIYVNNSTNNSISNNICNLNTENGIYITGSSYNTLSGNTCENNDSNTANDQAGMFITNNSDFNTISGNSLNNNNNIGAGDGFGLVIATATCEENVVASNNANGNDIDWKDAGSRSIIKYYVQSGDELQDAIDSIGTGAGTVIITNGNLSITAIILVNGGGDYVIEGEGVGSILETVGDITCFNITSAKSCVLKDFKIDATSLTTATREIIDITEAAHNKIICERLTIIGDGTNGYGIVLNSNNCKIKNCDFEDINYGIRILSNDCVINSNNITNVAGIAIDSRGDYNTITYNLITNSTSGGIYLILNFYNRIIGNSIDTSAKGILVSGSSYNNIIGNTTKSCTVGITISQSGGTYSHHNIINGNACRSNGQYGIYLDGQAGSSEDRTVITGNSINGGSKVGIFLKETIYCVVVGNNIADMTANTTGYAGFYGGIIMQHASTDRNFIEGNVIYNCNNIGGDNSYGIGVNPIWGVCDSNYIGLNLLHDNDVNIMTVGTNTIVHYTNASINALIAGLVDAAGAVAAVLADDKYIKNYESDGMNGDLTVNNLITAGNVDGVDISTIVAFKTITGITNDVVADLLTDTLTLAAVGGLTIVGTTATDTITFTNTITQYTDVMVEAIITAELVGGQSIDNRIDALLTANADGYQNQAGVEAIINTECGAGESIDNRIDALINTHNVANRHLDHTAITITAGVGLSGGGTIAADRTIDCDITQYTDAMVLTVITALFPTGLKFDYFGTGIKGTITTRDYEISISNGDDFDMLGWYVANGQASTPNCINKFTRNEATSGVIAGSDNAILVSHNHGTNKSSGSDGTNTDTYRRGDAYSNIQFVNSDGVSGVGKNIPAKISAIPIIRMG